MSEEAAADAAGKNDDATGKGVESGSQGQQTPKTFSQSELDSEVDRRVNQAQAKWKEEHDALLSDKTKDADTKIAELATKAQEAAERSTFLEAAAEAGVRNAKAAFLVAKHGGYIKDGKLDLDRFKKDNSEFFGAPAKVNAGNGSNQDVGKPGTLDALMRG